MGCDSEWSVGPIAVWVDLYAWTNGRQRKEGRCNHCSSSQKYRQLNNDNDDDDDSNNGSNNNN